MIKCKITYPDHNIIQYKNLVKREEYENLIKPIQSLISNLDSIIAGLNKKKHKETIQLYEDHKSRLKNVLSDIGEFFIDDSPLGKSISTGIMELPEYQGGKIKTIIEKWS